MLDILCQNLTNMFVSGLGFAFMMVLLEETAGSRYSRIWERTIWMLFWVVHYFGFSLYVSTYLAEKYIGEAWFSTFFLFLNIMNVWLGIIPIALLFKGSLQKNILTTLISEVFSVFLTSPLLMVLSKLIYGRSLTQWKNYNNPLTFLIPIEFAFLFYMIKTHWNKYLKAYASWEISHPFLVNVFIIVYLGIGMISNARYASSQGEFTYLLACILAVLTFSFLWYEYLYTERLKEERRHIELVYLERALREHYENVLDQTSRICVYNQEIRETMKQLMDRLLLVEEGSGMDGKDLTDKAVEQKEFAELAASYLTSLKDQYSELSVAKYSADYRTNQLLLGYEKMFQGYGVKTTFLLQDLSASGLSYQDMNALLEAVFDGMALAFKSSKEAGEASLILQAGIRGQELIISCESHGCPAYQFSRASLRKKRSIIRHLKADVSCIKTEDGVRIIIGVPC